MSVALLAIFLQSASISGSVAPPQGMAPPPMARAILLPLPYANLFNAEAQERIDNYWEAFKNAGMAQRQKEQFTQFMVHAYGTALENVVSQMQRDGKVNTAALMKNAPLGQFDFRGVPHGEYKLIVTANLKGTDYVWTETLQVESAPIVLILKNRLP
jgi:hypothetical protein